jgi:hypothetical protein
MPSFHDPIDLNKLEVLNPRLQQLASNPSGPLEGQFYYNTGTKKMRVYNGTSWDEWTTGAGAGSVTSVDLSAPGEITVGGTHPITGSGTIALSWSTQVANTAFMGPTSGGAATPSFRALVVADIPTLTSAKISDFDTQVRTSRLDQMAVPTGAVSFNGQKITSLGAPTASTDGATKGYVDQVFQGFQPKGTARVATTGALPNTPTYANGTSGFGATLTAGSNTTLTVDSYTLALGDNILVKDQATGAQNGLYTVTQAGSGAAPWILTRHTSMDTSAEFQGALIAVEDAGPTNANSLWLCVNSADPTVGTTAIVFTQLNKGTDLQSGTGITISGNTVSINTTYAGQASIVTLGTVTTGTWNATAIGLAYGGTGTDASTTSGKKTARDNLVAAGGYTALIGDASSTAFSITQATHGLSANGRLEAAVFDATTGEKVYPKIAVNNTNGTVTITFATGAPASNAYRVVILG